MASEVDASEIVSAGMEPELVAMDTEMLLPSFSSVLPISWSVVESRLTKVMSGSSRIPVCSFWNQNNESWVTEYISNIKYLCFMATFKHSGKLNGPSDLQR